MATTTLPTLHAYFGYRDAPAALDWLGRAFGFETTMRFGDDAGGIQHAELRLGDAAVFVFTDGERGEALPRRGETVGFGTYVWLADEAAVEAVHRRAVEAGAVDVLAPGATPWGNFRCRVADPEGYEWTFGTHRPGEPAGDW